MKQLGLIVAGLALVVVLNVLLVLLAGPHVIRTEHIVSTKTVTTL